jgi:hypothetical protein
MKRFNEVYDGIMEMLSADVIPTGETAPYAGDDPAGLQGDFYARGDARNATPKKKKCVQRRNSRTCKKTK